LLNRAGAKTRRPLVELKSGAEVTFEHLSAGERAALIALFTVARWMTPGGVVLIDEPELHQHVSLMRSNLAVLEHFVIEKMNGQLIVASHAPEVWDHFRTTKKRIIDLDLLPGDVRQAPSVDGGSRRMSLPAWTRPPRLPSPFPRFFDPTSEAALPT
jgi:hypothetical protein